MGLMLATLFRGGFRTRLSTAALAGLLLLGWSSPAFAIVTNYGDCDGAGTVVYEAVTETHTTAAALFGAPTCIGNTIDFDPTGFVASAPVIDPNFQQLVKDSQLNFRIVADSGNFIEEVILDEFGDFNLLGPAGNFVAATANVKLEINEIFNPLDPNNPNPGIAIQEEIQPQFVRLSPGDNTIGLELWSLNATFDVNQILIDSGFVAGTMATNVDLLLNNNLSVNAATGAAEIRKKDAEGLTITVVPEPTAGVLLGIGLAATAFLRRTRHQN
jgi:hypothetical protein